MFACVSTTARREKTEVISAETGENVISLPDAVQRKRRGRGAAQTDVQVIVFAAIHSGRDDDHQPPFCLHLTAIDRLVTAAATNKPSLRTEGNRAERKTRRRSPVIGQTDAPVDFMSSHEKEREENCL